MGQNDLVVCDYPSKVVKYGRLRVVFKDNDFYLQWLAGVAYPPRVTSERKVSLSTARAHYSYAKDMKNATHMHYKRWRDLAQAHRNQDPRT